eukprot:1795815-Amphidinium_carterae.1
MTTTIRIELHYRGMHRRRDAKRNEPTSTDEVLPQAPELPKEALYYYNRVLQYTLNKATKGDLGRTTQVNLHYYAIA